jgi:hypothetical protein
MAYIVSMWACQLGTCAQAWCTGSACIVKCIPTFANLVGVFRAHPAACWAVLCFVGELSASVIELHLYD